MAMYIMASLLTEYYHSGGFPDLHRLTPFYSSNLSSERSDLILSSFSRSDGEAGEAPDHSYPTNS